MTVTRQGVFHVRSARRSLTAVEIAHAAVTAALSAALTIIAVVVPFAGGLSLLVTVPMGLLGYRYRLKVLIAATCAAGMIAFLITGISGFMVIINCAYVGGFTGIMKRRQCGIATVIAVSIIAGTVFGVGVIAALAVLVRLRTLIFSVITANVDGVATILSQFEALRPAADDIRGFFNTALHYWPVLLLGYSIVTIMIVTVIGWWALSRMLDRLQGIPDVHKLPTPQQTVDTDTPPAPLPVRLVDARFRYPGAESDALGPLSLCVEPGDHIAVTGANGSGKTTLMLLLAGQEPTSGSVVRPGDVELGHLGGTAVIMQHPESQVLGTRVADDVVWGLAGHVTVDIDQLLDEVGLAGMQERDTGGLSGGELQRLAVAAALARQPALLIADEVTTMVDQPGREALLHVLSEVTDRHDMALVHITHYNTEADSADRVIHLSDSGDNTSQITGPAAIEMVDSTAEPKTASTSVNNVGALNVSHYQGSSTRTVLRLDGVGYEYDRGTPWANNALRDISMTVHEGDGLLVHGGNGSGKSTLAWIMAGLIPPTTGTCWVGHQLAHECVGTVAIAFQAARLQLMRSRVDHEIASAAGFSPHDTAAVVEALARVGLDEGLARRRVDQLSGGQMRRVVIAGLLARNPQVLILDEPLAGLDAASQRGLLALLGDMRRNTGLTVIVISHDFVGLEQLCPRTIHVHDGVIASMSPQPAEGSSEQAASSLLRETL